MNSRYTVNIDQLSRLIADFSPHQISEINSALRNVNLGKMDYLPYEAEVPGYTLSMSAILTPEGTKRAPAVGHWELHITPDLRPFEIILRGKSNQGQERADIGFWCPNSPEEDIVKSLT